MKLVLLPFVCLLGGAVATPVTLDKRQFSSSFPPPAQGQPQYLVQQKATGALISKAWAELGQTFVAWNTAMKCTQRADPGNPPPSLFLNCGVGEAHKAIVNKYLDTESRFVPNSVISFVDAGGYIVAASAALTMNQQTALKSTGDSWTLSVRTKERSLVYESLVQQLSMYQNWSKVFNNLMPTGTKTAGDTAAANIVSQYQALIKKYQWDVPT
jgi:hypothetical protein